MTELQEIARARHRLIKHIKAAVKPHMHASGYAGKDGPLMLTKIRKVNLTPGDADRACGAIREYRTCDVIGEDWLSDDADAGGLVSTSFAALGIADLVTVALHVAKPGTFEAE